ncbi:hypothetical protein ACFYWY_36470 [Streptomyces sp. NPDC002870]|uniref:hypothetical protein n=1 Tax=Streptomyces sp. NPDC002870 TaxID=3364666 RepID=UPI00369232F7
MPTRASRRPAPAAASPSPPLRTSNASIPALRTAHRRVSIARIGVWAALAAGPVALAVACAMPPSVNAAAQPKTTAPSALRTADPAGAAALFCDLWLRSDAAQADSSTARAVHALAPSVSLPNPAAKAAQVLQGTVAVRSVRLSAGSWSVVVAAQFTVRDDTGRSPGASDASTIVRYFAVPVVATDGVSGPGAFTVTAAPAQIAGPGPATVATSRYVKPLPAGGALVSSLGAFFDAYLAGVGEVTRYLSPGTQLSAVSGTGYTKVTVDQAAADSEIAVGAVPGDGSKVGVQARVTATDANAGTWSPCPGAASDGAGPGGVDGRGHRRRPPAVAALLHRPRCVGRVHAGADRGSDRPPRPNPDRYQRGGSGAPGVGRGRPVRHLPGRPHGDRPLHPGRRHMEARAVTVASAPQLVWNAMTSLTIWVWTAANWLYDNAWWVGLLSAVAWCGWAVLQRSLAAKALGRRAYVELQPSRQFETDGEEILRFGAQLIRAAGAGPWWTPRNARSVRIRLRADGTKPLSYLIEGPASAKHLLLQTPYARVRTEPAQPPAGKKRSHTVRAAFALHGTPGARLRDVPLEPDPLQPLIDAVADLRADLGDLAEVCLDISPAARWRIRARRWQVIDAARQQARRQSRREARWMTQDAATMEDALSWQLTKLTVPQDQRGGQGRRLLMTPRPPRVDREKALGKLVEDTGLVRVQLMVRCASNTVGRAERRLRHIEAALDVYAARTRLSSLGFSLGPLRFGPDRWPWRVRFDERWASGLIRPARDPGPASRSSPGCSSRPRCMPGCRCWPGTSPPIRRAGICCRKASTAGRTAARVSLPPAKTTPSSKYRSARPDGARPCGPSSRPSRPRTASAGWRSSTRTAIRGPRSLLTSPIPASCAGRGCST